MAKGDDAVMRKRSRVRRKKSHSLRTKESVSTRVAAIIASKRRRKIGKRRICEGMCFTLPTPEDPFNDRNDPKAKKEVMQRIDTTDDSNKNKKTREEDDSHSPLLSDRSRKIESNESNAQNLRKKYAGADEYSDNCLSKYLLLCLKAIQESWLLSSHVDDGGYLLQDRVDVDQRSPLFACKWGIDFWKSCCSGLDIMDFSGPCASREQVAWLVCTTSDIIVRKEKEGILVSSPFLLYLVPSQEKATEVRSICKPLKAIGVHSVSLHPGASLDHQIRGLKSCEPEFVVSTPERLLELVTLKILNISGVSLLVLDGLESLTISGFLSEVKSIREHISADAQTIIFGKNRRASSLLQLQKPFCRLSLRS